MSGGTEWELTSKLYYIIMVPSWEWRQERFLPKDYQYFGSNSQSSTSICLLCSRVWLWIIAKSNVRSCKALSDNNNIIYYYHEPRIQWFQNPNLNELLGIIWNYYLLCSIIIGTIIRIPNSQSIIRPDMFLISLPIIPHASIFLHTLFLLLEPSSCLVS